MSAASRRFGRTRYPADMLRSLLAVALALVPAATVGCTGPAKAELELVRPLVLTPVDDPKGALKRVAEAVRADPQSGLVVAEDTISANDHAPSIHEVFVTGPEKHVLEDYMRTHPELAPPAEHQFAYERRRDDEGRWYWRMHCVEAGGHAVRTLVSVGVVRDADNRPTIRLRLGPEDGERLAAITTHELGKRLAVVQDDEVLAAPIVLAPVTAGVFDISLAGAQTQGEVDAAFNHLLGR